MDATRERYKRLMGLKPQNYNLIEAVFDRTPAYAGPARPPQPRTELDHGPKEGDLVQPCGHTVSLEYHDRLCGWGDIDEPMPSFWEDDEEVMTWVFEEEQPRAAQSATPRTSTAVNANTTTTETADAPVVGPASSVRHIHALPARTGRSLRHPPVVIPTADSTPVATSSAVGEPHSAASMADDAVSLHGVLRPDMSPSPPPVTLATGDQQRAGVGDQQHNVQP